MNYEEVRLRCVEIAIAIHQNALVINPDNVVNVARILADFILGTNDSEIIGAARDFAKQVNDAR